MSAPAAPPAHGPGVSRIAGTAGQRNEPIARRPGQLMGPHHPQPVYGRGQMPTEFSRQARPGTGTGHEVSYQATSAAHGDLFSHVANPRVTLAGDFSTEIPDRGHRRPRSGNPLHHGADVAGHPRVKLGPAADHKNVS
jgi:hypothetical protein